MRPSRISRNSSVRSVTKSGGRPSRSERGRELFGRDRDVAEVPSRRLADLGRGVREGEEPRPGHLVPLPDVAIVGQRGDGDVGDVVDVDERLGHIPGRERQLPVEHRLDEKALTEVLAEHARPHDRPVDAGALDGLLGAPRAVLVPAREQDEAPDAARRPPGA